VIATRIPHLPTAILLAVFAILSACAAGQPTVVEKLDELTAVTVTYCREPLVMSRDVAFDRKTDKDYVQVGVMEVNRIGTFKYFLWLGITIVDQAANPDQRPEGFDSIVFAVGDESFQLDIQGWTPEAIGASEPVYKKLFAASADAYYSVTPEQIRLLTDVDNLTLRTTGSAPEEFIPWYKQETFESELVDFLARVSR
jgi:hypothetical protein